MYVVKGRFSIRWTDHALHPAWGWDVDVWWEPDVSPFGKHIAWGTVQWDGSYELTFDPFLEVGFPGKGFWLEFSSRNAFFKVVDGGGASYRFKGPKRESIGTVHDEGHRFADCDGTGALVSVDLGAGPQGVGEVYFRGYQLWSELYFRAGINPLREEPIVLHYPNSSYDCGRKDHQPWSCSSAGSAEIWLLAAHGLNRSTVQHELAHQIDSEFHNNMRPKGAGGSHSLTLCHNIGMALSEGYANFMPYWVQEKRSASPQDVINGLDLETPGIIPFEPYCKHPGKENEVWVAAAFWDLHDSHSDDSCSLSSGKCWSDTFWFHHEGAVHAIYLKNPLGSDGAVGMPYYRTFYRNAASPGDEVNADNVFRMNDTY